VVAYLGDDWTAGRGASSRAKRWTTLLSKQLGVSERNFGAAGTGYAKSSGHAGSYRSRVAAVVAAHPDVVVVSGGRNDARLAPAKVTVQARTLFETLHAKLPKAILIGLPPFWGDSATPVTLVPLAQAIKTAVMAAGGFYLDVPDPLFGHPKYMADAADPNDKGYAAIAAALKAKLLTLAQGR
jgi:lysophospholipase L1-like esterase